MLLKEIHAITTLVGSLVVELPELLSVEPLHAEVLVHKAAARNNAKIFFAFFIFDPPYLVDLSCAIIIDKSES